MERCNASTPLTPEQDAALDALIEDCKADAGALQSLWEAACIAAAFAQKSSLELLLEFTMQTWIDLDAIRSPLLTGGEFATAREFDAALAAFGHPAALDFEAAEASEITDEMQRAVARGFSTRLGMRQEGAERTEKPDDSFGEWLPLFTFLLAELHLGVAEARALEVAQAFALAATRRFLQGWEPAGTPYKMREVEGRTSKDEGPDGSAPPSTFDPRPSTGKEGRSNG